MREAIIGVRLFWHVLVAVFKLGVLMPRWSAARRRQEIARWSRGVFTLLGISLVTHGTEESGGTGRLYAGNHVSWLDIFALLATADVRFVAKAEVRGWPVIGWLAGQLGTHFIARSSRAEAYAGAQVVSALLEQGESVCIFPESSTTDGSHLQPFRTALFEAAIKAGAPVQPFAIRYRNAAGLRAEAAAFVGDMSLMESIGLLIHERDVTCELALTKPIESASFDRRRLARATESVVADQMGVELRTKIVTPAGPIDDAAGELAVA